MDYQLDESAQWSQAVQQAAGDLDTAVQTAMAKNAAQGFASPAGPALATILQVGNKAQTALTEANGKIYAGQRERIFQVEEFDLKMDVEEAKLAMELYKAELLNALAVEQAQQDADFEEWRADLMRANAETEKREVALIKARADIEHELNGFKKEQAQAEYLTLDAEVKLIDARTATAEKKLEILDSLYEVVAAEKLIIAAEQRRVVALELAIASKERLAEIKEGMIPLYLERADARTQLADAVTDDAEYRQKIVELGYDKIAVRDAQEEAEHQVKEAEYDHAVANEQLSKANMAVELLRAQSRYLLQDYQTATKKSLLSRENVLKKLGVDLSLSTDYSRKSMANVADVAMTEYQRELLDTEITAKLDDIYDVAQDTYNTVYKSAIQKYKHYTSSTTGKKIYKGSYSTIISGCTG